MGATSLQKRIRVLLHAMNNNINSPSTKIKPAPISPRRINFPLIVISLSVLGLTIAGILSILTPPKEVIVANDFTIDNYDRTQSTFKKVSFSGQEIEVPEQFNIYQAQNSTGTAQELVSRLIAEYQLPVDDYKADYWHNDRYGLAKNNFENYFVFSSAVTQEKNSIPLLTQEAINACLNFYNKYELLLGLQVQDEDILHFSGGFEPTTVKPEEAMVAHIPLTYQLDGYPLYFQNHSDYPFFCRVNNYYELERVVFRDFFQTWQVARQMPAISIEQAVENIRGGQASIISAESRIITTIDLNWINEADLYSVQLEYRYDEELKTAYPFYNFKAKLINSAGINIEATIITPAVASAIKQ